MFGYRLNPKMHTCLGAILIIDSLLNNWCRNLSVLAMVTRGMVALRVLLCLKLTVIILTKFLVHIEICGRFNV